MSVMFVENNEVPAKLAVCPKCGRQVRAGKDCECETIFIVLNKPR
jgi:hypothetical protein